MWSTKHSINLSPPQPVPDDGVAASNQRLGWVGKAWRDLIGNAHEHAEDRVARGRNYAKRGRVRALSIDPGLATAEVVCAEYERPHIRVKDFSSNEWNKVEKALTARLSLLAELLEGELSPSLAEALEASGVPLMPSWSELSFDCECGDHEMPCTHASALFFVLADAIDGDPFLLLTLRGRTRDQLLSQIRRHWGDDSPAAPETPPLDDPDPQADWFTSPTPIPDFPTPIPSKVDPAAGLLSLGPPPDDADLRQALLPIYEKGAEIALAARDAIPERAPMRRRAVTKPTVVIPFGDHEDDLDVPDATSPDPAAKMTTKATTPAAKAPAAPAPKAPAAPEPRKALAPEDITEALVDHLAAHDHLDATRIAAALHLLPARVHQELIELESLGIVVREPSSGPPQWRLG